MEVREVPKFSIPTTCKFRCFENADLSNSPSLVARLSVLAPKRLFVLGEPEIMSDVF